MRYLIRLSLPAGLLIWLVYQVASRFIMIPDTIAMPMMIVSILLMMIGIFYHGWCFGKGKNPYSLKGIKKSNDND
jgi:hypothetical protein